MAAARKRSKPVLWRGARVHDVAQVALAGALEQIRENARAARGGGDPEATHQLRVGVRRLRVVLREFRTLVDPGVASELTGELKWLFQRLGAVREYDVLLSEVVDPLREPDTRGFAELHAQLSRERSKAARAAARALKSERFERLSSSLRQLGKQLGQVSDGSPPARKWARRRLDKRLRKVEALGSAALGANAAARHELRKQLKKLRYAAELLLGVWPEKKVKRYLKHMARLQDVLGELTDRDVNRALLARAAESLGRSAGPVMQVCMEHLDGQARRTERKLRPLLADFEGHKHFWA